MCNIVIGYKKDFDITILEAIQYENDDGYGVAWINDDRSLTIKRSLKFDIVDVYNQMPEDRKIFMHFRWATHGNVDLKNCHPFEINVRGKKYAVMHNGIISIRRNNINMSDTWHFVNNKLKVWIMQFGLTDRTIKLIEKNLQYDRMILLDAENDLYYRFGEWEEDANVMYSSGLPTFGKNWKRYTYEDMLKEEEDEEREWNAQHYYDYRYDHKDNIWNREETMYLNQNERELTQKILDKWKYYKSNKEEVWG
jgi:predicted glutamine amidotransferase